MKKVSIIKIVLIPLLLLVISNLHAQSKTDREKLESDQHNISNPNQINADKPTLDKLFSIIETDYENCLRAVSDSKTQKKYEYEILGSNKREIVLFYNRDRLVYQTN